MIKKILIAIVFFMMGIISFFVFSFSFNSSSVSIQNKSGESTPPPKKSNEFRQSVKKFFGKFHNNDPSLYKKLNVYQNFPSPRGNIINKLKKTYDIHLNKGLKYDPIEWNYHNLTVTVAIITDDKRSHDVIKMEWSKIENKDKYFLEGPLLWKIGNQIKHLGLGNYQFQDSD